MMLKRDNYWKQWSTKEVQIITSRVVGVDIDMLRIYRLLRSDQGSGAISIFFFQMDLVEASPANQWGHPQDG